MNFEQQELNLFCEIWNTYLRQVFFEEMAKSHKQLLPLSFDNIAVVVLRCDDERGKDILTVAISEFSRLETIEMTFFSKPDQSGRYSEFSFENGTTTSERRVALLEKLKKLIKLQPQPDKKLDNSRSVEVYQI